MKLCKLSNMVIKFVFTPMRIYCRCISDTPIIGYMALILMLSQNGCAREIKCATSVDSLEIVCNHTMEWVSMQTCCYNFEKDYFYCCPQFEARRLGHSTRYGGMLIAGILFVLTVLFLCVFCTRCPVGRAIHKRQMIDRREDPNNENVSNIDDEHV